MRGRGRGSSLVGIMFVSVALVGVLFTCAGSWVIQKTLSSHLDASDGARRLAEACAQLAMARLIKNPAGGPADFPSQIVHLDAYPGGEGSLALDAAVARQRGIPLSVNNLSGKGSLPGWGDTVVAPETANLVAVGRYCGAEYRSELLLCVPAFPYVVGSSVPLSSQDGLTVFGITSPDALANGFANIPADKKVPGHVLSNGDDRPGGTEAMELLGPGTHIQGNARAHGHIRIGNGAVLTGDVCPLSDPAPLPHVDLARLDPASKPGNNPIEATSLSHAQLSGFNRAAGDLTITGGLELQGGVLYVPGSLTVKGGLKGKGAILATGSVEVEGGGSLEGDNQAAILAKGAVSLHGTAGHPAEYRGLVYTEGNLDCRYANVAGSIVVNNPDSQGSAVLEHTTLAECPQLASQSFPINSTMAVATPGQSGGRLWVGPNADLGPAAFTGFGTQPAVVAFLKEDQLPTDSSGAATVPTDLSDPFRWMTGHVRINLPPGTAVTLPPARTSTWHIGGEDVYFCTYESKAECREVLLAAMAVCANSCPDPQAAVEQILAGMENEFRSHISQWVTEYNRMQATGQSPPATPGTVTQVTIPSQWTLDLSQFLSLSERIRILSWRQL